MTKRTLYARLQGMLCLAAGAVALLAVSERAFAQPAPCASCLVPVITPGAGLLFPERLEGFDVLVRVAAGRESDAAEALEQIAQRGGRPGLLIRGLPEAAPDPVLLSRVHTIVIELDDGRSSAAVFALTVRSWTAASGTNTTSCSVPRTRPSWLLRPLTPRMSVRMGYDLDYTRFARGTGTAPDFVEPQNQVVHGARIALDAQRGGWSATAWWNPARRQGWRPWGPAAGAEHERKGGCATTRAPEGRSRRRRRSARFSRSSGATVSAA